MSLLNISKGMICHYPLNEVLYKTVYDTSGSINNASTSITAFSSNSPRYNQAIQFNGTSNYISTGQLLSSNNTSFSISFWIKANTLATHGIFVSKTVMGKGIAIFLLSNGSTLYPVFDDGQRSTFDICTFPVNSWVYLCFTRTSSSKKAYVNFNESKIQTDYNIGDLTGIGTKGVIGASQNSDTGIGDGNYLNGYMSDFRIYNTDLSDSDVADLYRIGESVTSDGQVLSYEFREESNLSFSQKGIISCTELIGQKDTLQINKTENKIYANDFTEV